MSLTGFLTLFLSEKYTYGAAENGKGGKYQNINPGGFVVENEECGCEKQGGNKG